MICYLFSKMRLFTYKPIMMLCAIMLLGMFFNGTFAQDMDIHRLDTYFNTLESNDKFMGSVAILKDGKVVYDKQVGYSNLELEQQPDVNTSYGIGSISKVFTAVLIFKAIEEGMLDLDGTIEGYFPSIINSEKITIAQLLSHRSGVFNFTDDKENYLSYHTSHKSPEEMVNIIAQGGSMFEPGDKGGYSNSNYVLLSIILEKVYGQSYAAILWEQLIDPLGLAHTYFGGPMNGNQKESRSYTYDGRWKLMEETDPSIGLGAGGIVSTPSDLLVFADALFTGGLFSKASLSKMKTIRENFGMGLFKIAYNDHVSYGHNGEIDGFIGAMRYFEDDKYGFVVLSNGLNYTLNTITVTMVNALYGKHYDIPDFRVYHPRAKELDAYLGVYSSESFPVKLSITRSGKQLFVQAPGDAKMKMVATAKGEFKYEPAGIAIRFFTENGQLAIIQGGKTHVLTRE